MRYPGGKNGSGVYQTIINEMPPHEIYIEPFLGSGAVMRFKRPSRLSIGIDVDADVLNKWRSIDYPGLELIRADALSWLAEHDPPGALYYLDPPYLMESRSYRMKLYKHELYTEDEHLALLKIIKAKKAKVIISGYYSDLYTSELSTWRTVKYNAQTRTGVKTEWLWLNYPDPLELHDYRYLGDNFRERERIKRKKDRWKNKLASMPALERRAIMAAIQELRE